MGQFLKSISVALQNIRANPLHTFLSTLGIVIGVAAMVGILALGDGLEKTARDQIESTTDIENLIVSSNRYKTLDDFRIPIKDPIKLTLEDAIELESKFKGRAIIEMYAQRSASSTYKDSTSAHFLDAHLDKAVSFLTDSIALGRYIERSDLIEANNVVVLTKPLSENLQVKEIGEEIKIEGKEFEVIGILSDKEAAPKAFIPITTYWNSNAANFYPGLIFKVSNIEEIESLKEELNIWFDNNFESGRKGITITTNQARVKQFSQGILLFKLIMGAITGISVLVGGIGVMNVLLISVTERTKEIGIRKATGAKKKDIILQFMAESITISFVGCIMGWIIGIIGIFTFVPIVNALTDLGEFQAAIGGGTVLSILAISLFIGVIFGTYPAWRAAQLTPVDAIRHE
jgi:putative ABC transport system permease protein